MTLTQLGRRAVFAAAMLPLFAMSAPAQDIPESQMAAARAAIRAIHATDQFDAILPSLAEKLRAEMLQRNPNLQDSIDTIVDEKTIEMAGRRTDLEDEAARAYARAFSEAELTDIANFYGSEAGKKLLADGPIVSRELIKAAEVWQTGIARDLTTQVNEEMKARVGDQVQTIDAPEAKPAN